MRKLFLFAALALTLASCGQPPTPSTQTNAVALPGVVVGQTPTTLDLPNLAVAIDQHQTIVAIKPNVAVARYCWSAAGVPDTCNNIYATQTDTIPYGNADGIRVWEVDAPPMFFPEATGK